jgi:hypothetical protein
LFIDKYQTSMPKLTQWAEDNIPEGLSIFPFIMLRYISFILRSISSSLFISISFSKYEDDSIEVIALSNALDRLKSNKGHLFPSQGY